MTGRPRWRDRSLRTRIVATTALLSLAGMAVLVALTGLVLDRSVDHSVAQLLTARAETIAAGTTPSGDDPVWVFDADGVRRSGPTDDPLAAAAAGLAGAPPGSTREAEESLLLVSALPDDDGSIVVATSLEPYETTRHLALLVSGAVGGLVVVAVTALTAITVRRVLRPVRSMARDAATWSAQDLDRRFDRGPAQDEISELGAVLNGLLDRVAQVLRAEQRLTAELAHELRTPLTVIRAEAELADHPRLAPDDRERLDRIVAASAHMNSVIDSLLSTARGSVAERVRTEVATVLSQTSAGPGVPVGGPNIVVRARAGLLTSAPAEVVQRALSPLLANALHYARDRVTITAERDGSWVVIDVQDDGPGVAEPSSIFEPGHRDPDSPGAGLGLPLARRVARAGGGDVRLAGTGPTVFRLTLPAVD